MLCGDVHRVLDKDAGWQILVILNLNLCNRTTKRHAALFPKTRVICIQIHLYAVSYAPSCYCSTLIMNSHSDVL